MKSPKAMLKPAMCCTGVDILGKPELLDIPQALKIGMFNKFKDETLRYGDKSMYRIINYLGYL